jgi:hypothetical protein
MLRHPGAEIQKLIFCFLQKRLHRFVIKILKLHKFHLAVKTAKTAKQVTCFFMIVLSCDIFQTIINFRQRIDNRAAEIFVK